MIRVTENLKLVRAKLENAAEVAGRRTEDILLLAVSKRHSEAAIQAAIDAGQHHFGENYVEEGVAKIEQLGRAPLVWHFIGALQSNKTRAVAEHFDWVHTIDRLRIARRLSEQRPSEAPPLQVCLQVNIDAEPQKAGVAVDEVFELAGQVAELPRVTLRGLMCLPRPRTQEEDQQAPFRALRVLLEQLREVHPELDTLSMGMSQDLDAAILQGSTIVRVGTAIFGERPAD